MAFEQGKYEAAVTYFHEATISGAYFERYDVLEEAFRLAAEAHLVAGRKGPYAPLTPAVAASHKLRFLNASLLTSMGEQLTSNGDLPAATAATQARNAIGRREMARRGRRPVELPDGRRTCVAAISRPARRLRPR